MILLVLARKRLSAVWKVLGERSQASGCGRVMGCEVALVRPECADEAEALFSN